MHSERRGAASRYIDLVLALLDRKYDDLSTTLYQPGLPVCVPFRTFHCNIRFCGPCSTFPFHFSVFANSPCLLLEVLCRLPGDDVL